MLSSRCLDKTSIGGSFLSESAPRSGHPGARRAAYAMGG